MPLSIRSSQRQVLGSISPLPIASHTWLALQEAGFDVIGIDNLVNSSPKVLERLQRLDVAALSGELLDMLTADDRHQAVLDEVLHKTGPGLAELAPVLAPLGVLLPSGLGLKIDDKDIGRAGFVRCLTTGCVAEVVMDDTLLGQLKSAEFAVAHIQGGGADVFD